LYFSGIFCFYIDPFFFLLDFPWWPPPKTLFFFYPLRWAPPPLLAFPPLFFVVFRVRSSICHFLFLSLNIFFFCFCPLESTSYVPATTLPVLRVFSVPSSVSSRFCHPEFPFAVPPDLFVPCPFETFGCVASAFGFFPPWSPPTTFCISHIHLTPQDPPPTLSSFLPVPLSFFYDFPLFDFFRNFSFFVHPLCGPLQPPPFYPVTPFRGGLPQPLEFGTLFTLSSTRLTTRHFQVLLALRG